MVYSMPNAFLLLLLSLTTVSSIWKCKNDTSKVEPKPEPELVFNCPTLPSSSIYAFHINAKLNESLHFDHHLSSPGSKSSQTLIGTNTDKIHDEIKIIFKRLGLLNQSYKMDVAPQKGTLLIQYNIKCRPPNNTVHFVQQFRTVQLNFSLIDLCAQSEDFFIPFKATEYELGEAIESFRTFTNPVRVSYEEGLYLEGMDNNPLKILISLDEKAFDVSFKDYWKDLFTNMTKSISQSNMTGVNWDGGLRTWDPSDVLEADIETNVQKKFKVPDRRVAKVYQLVGKCGPFIYRGEVNIILFDKAGFKCEVGWKGFRCPFKTMPEIEHFLKHA